MRVLFSSLTVALAILSAPGSLPGQTGEPVNGAEDLVRTNLARAGVRLNYDPVRQSVVAIGVASCGVGVTENSANLTTARGRLVQEATLRAKAKLLSFVVQCMGGREGVSDRSGPSGSEWRSFVEVSSWSKRELEGCLVLDSAEVAERNVLTVAVAVEWSASLERDIRDIALGRVEITSADRQQALSILEGKNLPALVGTRFLKLKDGFNYPVGVGAVDVEDARGLVLSARMREVGLAAAQAYEGAFRSTIVTRRKGNASVQNGQDAEGERWMRVADDAVSFGLSTSSNANLIPREVLWEGQVKDPVSRRKVYVLVYGPRLTTVSRTGGILPTVRVESSDF